MRGQLLIVDDSAVSRHYVQRILEISGYDFQAVLEAHNGREAIDVLRTTPVDLLITDISMPEMNGDELMRWTDRHYRGLPVVVISSDSSAPRSERLTRTRGFVAKPFSPERLRAEVDRILALYDGGEVLGALLPECVETALETMFFTSLVEAPDHVSVPPAGCVWARVRYEGGCSGIFTLGVEPSAARSIASNFLATDIGGLSQQQMEETVCELANVVCGSVLSRSHNRRELHLSPPKLVPENSVTTALARAGNGKNLLRFQCEDGCILASFSVAA